MVCASYRQATNKQFIGELALYNYFSIKLVYDFIPGCHAQRDAIVE
jgi:hypothetical protein